MVDVVIAVLVSGVEVLLNDGGIAVWCYVGTCATLAHIVQPGHILDDPGNLRGPERWMGMASVCLVLLEVALEHFQHILQTVRVSAGVDTGRYSGKTVKIKIHAQSSRDGRERAGR